MQFTFAAFPEEAVVFEDKRDVFAIDYFVEFQCKHLGEAKFQFIKLENVVRRLCNSKIITNVGVKAMGVYYSTGVGRS
jgi:hypothetical protein